MDEITTGLLRISEAIGAGLDGHEGGRYGCMWDNETFSMTRYCWCSEDGCLYCDHQDDRDSRVPHFHHKATGLMVWWYKYIGRDQVTKGDCIWDKVVAECLISIRGPHEIL